MDVEIVEDSEPERESQRRQMKEAKKKGKAVTPVRSPGDKHTGPACGPALLLASARSLAPELLGWLCKNAPLYLDSTK
jgi:hypothetical protein